MKPGDPMAPMASIAGLKQFHLGISESGERCLMVFLDEDGHAMETEAEYSEFLAFVNELVGCLLEMAKRQGLKLPDLPVQQEPTGPLS